MMCNKVHIDTPRASSAPCHLQACLPGRVTGHTVLLEVGIYVGKLHSFPPDFRGPSKYRSKLSTLMQTLRTGDINLRHVID